MPNKICPKCQTPSGVRTLACKCGHEFRKSKKELMTVVEEVKKIAVKESVQPPPHVKVVIDPKIVLKEQAEALGFSMRGGEVYKFVESHKYYAVVASSGKIIGIQRDCL